ncbi:[weak similarity to] protein involved in exopolysaccharide biosynthesis, partial [methanotrophic bacterial endosymbiont of Bathymodiolus sp.]
EHIDFDIDTISVPGEEPRTIPLNSALKDIFKLAEPCPAWNKNQDASAEMLAAILVYASVDARFPEAQEITADTISHTYIVDLVKQGLRISELEQLIGYTNPATLAKYSLYSPEKRGLPITEINLLHPALL